LCEANAVPTLFARDLYPAVLAAKLPRIGFAGIAAEEYADVSLGLFVVLDHIPVLAWTITTGLNPLDLLAIVSGSRGERQYDKSSCRDDDSMHAGSSSPEVLLTRTRSQTHLDAERELNFLNEAY
jgi:hypothetical protein